ncbi:MAG TPA: creatininase family protein [Bryobacteraceae bacterium]|jgi:creatinine amidohydrolase/Fe(II)-dependent formamide hydrolase-like protein|nr:creatininase family protein [Bryobacteraceae bacterium]
MKMLIWILCNLNLALVSAPVLRAQDIDASSPLREYVNPPAVRPVDTVFMEDMTWLEIRNAMKAGKTTVIVPAGGLEASGPFLVLDKHQRMLHGSTDMIARKLGTALIAPVIRYVPPDDGNRGNYVGDFNISLAAYKSTLADVCTALKNDGFKEIVLIGDHQGAQRGMKEVADELSRKWTVGSTGVQYIAEYYDRTAVANYVKTTLGITETRGGFGDNYYNTSILMALSPESARLQERTEAHQLTVNGVNLEPIQKTIENGKVILQMQTDQTVKAIQKAIARTQSH